MNSTQDATRLNSSRKTRFQKSEGTIIQTSKPLQAILGTDKRNPVFSVYREEEKGLLHVYYGATLLESLPDDREHMQYKLLVARLYNAKVKASVLQEVFAVDRKTMKKWGEALKQGDEEKLTRVLAGRRAGKKLTLEIKSFIKVRFPSIYQETRYEYSRRMRDEIEQVFGVKVSGETLRPLLKTLKMEFEPKNRETPCDFEPSNRLEEGENLCQNEEIMNIEGSEEHPDSVPNRKECPETGTGASEEVSFCHHVGVLVFGSVFARLDAWMGEENWILKQWLATILLGAVNLEQTKLLDFDDLKCLFGKCLRSLHEQRQQLGQLATTDAVEQILRFNADEVNASAYHDFYYDPHTKRYTGIQKVLKGWCPSVRMADKALHMDFIHTAGGHPVFMQPTDNYYDLRERFFPTVQTFRNLLGIDKNRVLTWIVDRGIYSHAVFDQVIEDPASHLITWERNYQAPSWNSEQVGGTFPLQRSRNRAADVLTYTFEYIEEPWEKDPRMRRLRVQAVNPKGNTIEVGVLTDDWQRPAPEIIELIFRRWIQENDFKYLDKHFGINEITSYAVIPYKQMEAHLKDKQMKSGEHKALLVEHKQVREQLGKLLLREHEHPGKNAARTEKIQSLTKRLQEIQNALKESDEEISRLEFLIQQNYVRLETRNKYLMDALKILARNVFYNLLEPFKKEYDNYRDDHTLFRPLTQSHGVLRQGTQQVEASLYPQPNYPPKVRQIMEQLLDDINATNPTMPDGSGRKLLLRLGKKTEIEFAIVSG